MNYSILNFSKIMLIEDDDIDRESIMRLFRKHKIINRLLYANNGYEAILQLEKYNPEKQGAFPDLIILDINMPKVNGFEFLKYLRGNQTLKETSVIILTTSDREQDIKQAQEYDILDYLIKPLNDTNFSVTTDSRIM